jgi:Acetyltransferase (GNAT) domain
MTKSSAEFAENFPSPHPTSHTIKLNVQLYDASTVATLPWPDSEVAQLTKNYWLPLMLSNVSAYIDNIKTQLLIITIDDLVLPMTVNQQEYENSYVCSFYSHYITYAQDELVNLKSPILENMLSLLLTGVGYFLKWVKINKAVIVNNWMLSTNLYPELSTAQIAAITQHLKQTFPDHAIAFRSINEFTDRALKKSLQIHNYQMVGSRQVYLLNPNVPTLSAKRRQRMKQNLKQDFKRFETYGYQAIDANDIQSSDIPRIVELYNALYLQKYSDNNPHFNQNCVALMRDGGFLELIALRKAGRIDGIIGFYRLNGVMTTPLLGYDTSLPQDLGLYRILTAFLIQTGSQKGLIINQSSGAASFKRHRGFSGWTEYSAVFHRHLSLDRRLGWLLLGGLVDLIAIPLMRRYKL